MFLSKCFVFNRLVFITSITLLNTPPPPDSNKVPLFFIDSKE